MWYNCGRRSVDNCYIMAVYIPLRSFTGGYHAKTPLRCYIFR
ncbi:MAG: hypothetical protein HDT42_03165 [Ruminococcaceae bacterium]|nr:hypothetical protein [Oscillospiraceae bacterium]